MKEDTKSDKYNEWYNHPLTRVARDLIEEYYGNFLEKGKYFIYSEIGEAPKEGIPVFITDGQFMGQYGLSNHWHWQRVTSSGELAEKSFGYGAGKEFFFPVSEEQALSLAKKLEQRGIQAKLYTPDPDRILFNEFVEIANDMRTISSEEKDFIESVKAGNKKLVIIFLRNGVDINVLDGVPLIRACQNNHKEIVKLLIEYGANINGRNGLALEIAIRDHNVGIRDVLMNYRHHVPKTHQKLLEKKDILSRYDEDEQE